MKNLVIGAAIAAFAATAAYADDAKKEGALGGGVTGAIGGAVIGGPVGAVVGGVAGAAIGGSLPAETRTYVVEHPVDSVQIEGELTADYVIPAEVTIHTIPSAPEYGYIYVDDRPVVVQLETRKVVYVQ